MRCTNQEVKVEERFRDSASLCRAGMPRVSKPVARDFPFSHGSPIILTPSIFEPGFDATSSPLQEESEGPRSRQGGS